MIRTPYEIVTPDEFLQMGYQAFGRQTKFALIECANKELKEAARKALFEYQVWQNGLHTEETQKPFEEAVDVWRRLNG